jgi:hypothetical protein
VRRALASSFLSLLLVTTLVWGGCISCEQYFMWPGVKSCCAPNGHCKTKTPAKQNPGPECKQIAFEHQKSLDLHIDLPALTVVQVDLPICPVQLFACSQDVNPVGLSPPDLNVLHSTFLI